jgi:transcriptional regulator with XRE-family HTH domain
MAKPPRTAFVSDRAYYDDFRARLRTIRDELGWSQADMADALNLSVDTYKKYESRSKFPAYLFERLALITHRRIEYIVTGKGRPKE